MKKLTIHLAYEISDAEQRSGLLLPVRALDDEGSVLDEGVVGVRQPAMLSVPENTKQAFVRITWPSGRTHTRRVVLADAASAELTFSDASIASNEWSAWAVPRLNPRTPLASSQGDVNLNLNLQRFDKVWLRLWRRVDGTWRQERVLPDKRIRSDAAWQLDLTLEKSAWLLQLGGSNVPWRFVSLPGGGAARVLLTPNDSDDPRSDPLKVVVTGFRADAETLLEFLARDSMRAADVLAESAHLAQKLFLEKLQDPVSAVAGAYYLLRRGDWNRVPQDWFDNLSRRFDWLPDAPLLHCLSLLRKGSDAGPPDADPIGLLMQSLERGWPVYEEGVALLQEAVATLRSKLKELHPELITQVQALVAAKSWAGSATSFYGRQPDAPTALQWVGMPRAPRRRRLDPALRLPSVRVEQNDLALLGFAEARAASNQERRPASAGIRRAPKPQTPEVTEFLLGSIVER